MGLLNSNTPVNDSFQRFWQFEKLGRRGSDWRKQNLRVACPKGKKSRIFWALKAEENLINIFTESTNQGLREAAAK